MTDVNRDSAIADLEAFVRDLQEYQELLRKVASEHVVTRDLWELGEKLTRESGRLRPLVEAVIGEIRLVTFGQPYNPWYEAFDRELDNPRIASSVNALIQSANHVIGNLSGADLQQLIPDLVRPRGQSRPKVCILHDGESDVRTRLEMECWRLGLDPVVVEEETSQDESVDDKVDRVLGSCEFAIVLARRERGVTQDGSLIPRGNVIDEIGRVRARLGDKYIILLEKGLTLPTNLSTGVVYEGFDETAFDPAILKVFIALRNTGVI